jgi:protocatechuate 3,4-dioxygenase beta subunit
MLRPSLAPQPSWPALFAPLLGILVAVLTLEFAGPVEARAESHIRGLVTGESGEPLVEALVTALAGRDDGAFEPLARARTDREGRYDLVIDRPGCYLVRARAVEHQAAFYPSVADPWEATCVEVREGAVVEGIDIRLRGAGAIGGRITDARTHQPIARAHVSAWPAFTDTTGGGDMPPGGGGHGDPNDPDWSEGGGHAVTDSTGTYLIDGLAAGTYLVHAEAEGYIAEFYLDAQYPEEATPITVESGHTVTGIDLALSRGGCIHGRVTDERTHAPIAGAYVSLGGVEIPPPLPPDPPSLPPDGGNGGHGDDGVVFPELGFRAVTDEDGRFSLCGLAPGEYVLHAWAEGYLGELYDDAACWHDADPVVVPAEGDIFGIDFALSVGGSIAGRIHDGAAPVPGALVQAWPARADTMGGDPDCGWNGGGGATAIADSDGNYVLAGLATGRYRVLAEARGFLPTFYGGGQDPEHATPVAVTAPHETSGIDIALERGGAISGTVRDQDNLAPIAGVLVEVYLPIEGGPGIRWFLSAETDRNGVYRIDGVPGGEHFLFASGWHLGYEPEFYRESSTPEGATPVVVVPPAEVAGIDFTLIRMRPVDGAISGQVTAAEDGSPIAGAVVTAISLAGYAGFGVSDSSGSYWIPSLPASEYVVLAAASGRMGVFYDQVPSWEDATPVRVEGPVAGIDFELAPLGFGPGIVTGRVIDAEGDPVVQAAVYAEREGETGPRGFAMSGAEGRYVIAGLEPGPYQIRATRPGMDDAYYMGDGGPGGPPAFVMVEQGQLTGVDVILGATAAPPAALTIEPSVPNPFRDAVAIRIVADHAAAPITVDVYSVSGRHVRRLIHENTGLGLNEIAWNGRETDGALAPSGVYVYRATIADRTVSGRLVLIR